MRGNCAFDAMMIVWLFVALFVLSYSQNAPSNKKLSEYIERWKSLSQQFRDDNRNSTINAALAQAKGVYNNHGKASAKNSVLVQVIEVMDDSYEQADFKNKYLPILLNNFCYMRSYNLKTVLYVITNNQSVFTSTKDLVKNLHHLTEVVEYPYEMFWNFVATKSTNITSGNGRADYDGYYPTFKHFGALPMVLPMYEVLSLGYDVIFLDIDLAILSDPIEELVSGENDINITPELRYCGKYPSIHYLPQFPILEGNTGTMYIRSSNTTVNFVYHWILRIVRENAMNDQKVLNLHKHGKSIWTKSCDRDYNDQSKLQRYYLDAHKDERQLNGTVGRNGVKYCFLDEFRYQNGLIGDYCPQGKRGGIAEMYRLGMLHISNAVRRDQPRKIDTNYNLYQILNQMNFFNDSNSEVHFRVHENYFFHPTILHANYCKVKKKFLHDRGLWLVYDENIENIDTERLLSLDSDKICKPFNIEKTIYFTTNWTELLIPSLQSLVRDIKDSYQRAKMKMKEDYRATLVKYNYQPTVYRIDYHPKVVFRPLYNLTALIENNYTFEQIIPVYSQLMTYLDIGPYIRKAGD